MYLILPMLKSVQYFANSLFYAWTIHFEIKRMCHRPYLFMISSGNFHYLTNFLNRWNNNTSPKYRSKIVVIFSQPLSMKLLPMTSNLLENVQGYLLSQVLTRYCMIYFGNSSKIGILFLEWIIYNVLKKSDVENLKNLFFSLTIIIPFRKKNGVTELILYQEGQI